MAKYVLLLRGDPAEWSALAPEDMQRIMGRYMTWGDELRAQGREVSGEQLIEPTSALVSRDGDDFTVVDGPYIETKECIGGFYVITAADRDDAIAVARDCPVHLHGGTVEVVQVVEGYA
jgi:hypothetical protein